MTIGCIGAGSWGTTLSVLLAEQGNQVLLWAHGQEQRESLRQQRENRKYLPGVRLPDAVSVCGDLSEAVEAETLLIATPTQFIRQTLQNTGSASLSDRLVINTSKGIERGTLLRISQLVEELIGTPARRYVVLTGPSHAEEVSRGDPAALVAASVDIRAAELTQKLFSTDSLRVYTATDVVGTEIAGALKNVMAICSGIVDGLEYGDNTKAALITRGLAELARLGEALGADPMTFAGLSGLGDLIVTCTSRHSRNRYVGEQIGRGRKLDEIVAEMSMVAEGITTTESALALAHEHGVEMPITQQVSEILFNGKQADAAIRELMCREMKPEKA